MITTFVTNVNTALAWGVALLQDWETDPKCVVEVRGAKTVEAPSPVTTVYLYPAQRVLMNPVRDANPFFHFFEALWMLAGRSDLDFPRMFNSKMHLYSDNGERIWGAYGWRWRTFFGKDQLEEILALLRKDPTSRRAVLTMWAPNGDLWGELDGEGGINGKDIPCNTHCYFKVRGGALNMTICNRSNDMIWGAYGANAVHMSMLQEYMASKLGYRVGVMRQMSDSFHVYLSPERVHQWEALKKFYRTRDWLDSSDPYDNKKECWRFPLGANESGWDTDLQRFMEVVDSCRLVGAGDRMVTAFFRAVVLPLWRGWITRDVEEVEQCASPDWRRAAREWLQRREK